MPRVSKDERETSHSQSSWDIIFILNYLEKSITFSTCTKTLKTPRAEPCLFLSLTGLWPKAARKGSKWCLITPSPAVPDHPADAPQCCWLRALLPCQDTPASGTRVRLPFNTPLQLPELSIAVVRYLQASNPSQHFHSRTEPQALTLSSLRGSALDSSRIISIILSTCSATAAPPLSLLSCSATRAWKGDTSYCNTSSNWFNWPTHFHSLTDKEWLPENLQCQPSNI